MDSSSGVHSVWECEIHQNCMLIAAALPSQVDYKMVLKKMACDVSDRNWVHIKKGVTITDMTFNVNDFIDQVCSMFDDLKRHHFIAKT